MNLLLFNLVTVVTLSFLQSVQRYLKVKNCRSDSAGAKFSKLLRKIFGRLLFQRKYADFRNLFGKCLWKNL